MRPSRAVGGAVVLLLVALTWGVSRGPLSIPVADVWASVAHRLFGVRVRSVPSLVDTVVWDYRMPHYLLSALVGGSLALAGVATQAVVRNPLGDPYVLGISAGTAFVAVAALVVVPNAPFTAIAAAAFAGGVVTMLVVLPLSSRGGQLNPLRLLLTGIALGQLFGSLLSLALAQLGQAALGVSNWLGGSVDTARMDRLWLLAILLPAAVIALLLDAGRLDALSFGEESAASLGVDVHRLRRRLVVVASLLTAGAVCLSGLIGFVGLVIPHIARLLVGPDHRFVIPLVVPLGAAFLVACDHLSRNAIPDRAIPIGVVTGLFGAPVFLWMLRSQSTSTAG